jgi:hypothetical protein
MGNRPMPAPIKLKHAPHLTEGPRLTLPLANSKLVITSDVVAQASRYVRSGATEGKIVEGRDLEQTGLILRLQSRSATWLLRRRRSTFTIGNVVDISIYNLGLGDSRTFVGNYRSATGYFIICKYSDSLGLKR